MSFHHAKEVKEVREAFQKVKEDHNPNLLYLWDTASFLNMGQLEWTRYIIIMLKKICQTKQRKENIISKRIRKTTKINMNLSIVNKLHHSYKNKINVNVHSKNLWSKNMKILNIIKILDVKSMIGLAKNRISLNNSCLIFQQLSFLKMKMKRKMKI